MCSDTRCMDFLNHRYLRVMLIALAISAVLICSVHSQNLTVVQKTNPSRTTLEEFVKRIQQKADALQGTSGMRSSFQAFVTRHKLPSSSIRYSDYVVVRLLFEATRDAGFWNLHWAITDQPPNSDRIWQQWKGESKPSPLVPAATAECDELSALYAFLVERAGVKSVGLFWPAANHTVAVWTVRPSGSPVIRVVVPTSQIFLDENDTFDTKNFDPWRQKTIYEYTRHDVPDSFEIPVPLISFFLNQADKYGGASEFTLQQLRYMRASVFLRQWSAERAASEALARRDRLKSPSAEDVAAFENFAQDMRAGLPK